MGIQNLPAELADVVEGVRGLCPRSARGARVLDIISQLEQMLAEHGVVKVLATAAGMSVSRIEHIFKQATGWPPGVYARVCRLRQAEYLLLSTRLTVKEVAAQCGWHPSRLAADFRAAFGMAPREYRNSRKRPMSDSAFRSLILANKRCNESAS